MTDQNKLIELQQMLETAEASLNAARQILRDMGVDNEDTSKVQEKARKVGSVNAGGDDKIVEGIFDGQHMVGPDGKRYSVPANYASKSKLVEGDMLKLTITADGSFVYKQIGPVDRNRLVGKLLNDETTGEFKVLAGNKTYKVLLASITYFKGQPGDEIVILVPKATEAIWAAVENIIKVGESHAALSPEGNGEVTEPEVTEDKAGAPDADAIDDIN